MAIMITPMSSPKIYVLSLLLQAVWFASGFCLFYQKHSFISKRNNIGTTSSKIRLLLSSARAVSLSSQIELNPLITDIKISKTVEVFSLVKQMEEDGEKVTSLCVGEPDFPPPPAVLEATFEAVRQGKTTYTAVTGTASLREAIAHDLRSRKGVSYDSSTEIVVGNGAKQCVFQVSPFCSSFCTTISYEPQ
jgi:DNA-binding transcriptional MocR family regulator